MEPDRSAKDRSAKAWDLAAAVSVAAGVAVEARAAKAVAKDAAGGAAGGCGKTPRRQVIQTQTNPIEEELG